MILEAVISAVLSLVVQQAQLSSTEHQVKRLPAPPKPIAAYEVTIERVGQ
jgi:hypothetical protein